ELRWSRGTVLAAAVVGADAKAELPRGRGERTLRKGEQAEREQLPLHSFCSPSALSAHGPLGLVRPVGSFRLVGPHGLLRPFGTHDLAELEAHRVRDLPPSLAAGPLIENARQRALQLLRRGTGDSLLFEARLGQRQGDIDVAGSHLSGWRCEAGAGGAGG